MNHDRTEKDQSARKQIELLATLMDDCFEMPVIGIRFGWDSMIGLIPVVGDFAGMVVSLWIFYQALLLQAPMSVLLRVLINIAIDAVFGVLPFVGDLLDLAWKGNRRNAQLLMRYFEEPRHVTRRSTAWVVGFLLGVAVVLFSLIGLVTWGLWTLGTAVIQYL